MTGTDKAEQTALSDRVGRDAYVAMTSAAVREHFRVRALGDTDKAQIYGGSLEQLEDQIDALGTQIDALAPPAGLHPVDLYVKTEEYNKIRLSVAPRREELRRILRRSRTRLHAYLVDAERELAVGAVGADVFARTRAYLEKNLSGLPPEVLDQFKAAYDRSRSGDPESLSHALTSCRRLLKSVSDALYPPGANPVVGADGKTRNLTEDRYLNRLVQFVAEAAGRHGSGDVVQSALADLGRRLTAVDGLACKGVHSYATVAEVDTCMIQTYLLVADVLRIRDGAARDRRPVPAG